MQNIVSRFLAYLLSIEQFLIRTTQNVSNPS